MGPTIWELPTSGEVQYEPPAATRRYRTRGLTDEAAAFGVAALTVPLAVLHPTGTLFRQDLKVKTVGWQLHEVEVTFGPRKRSQPGEWDIEFDTSGGSVHLRQSRETRGAWKAGGHAGDGKKPGAAGSIAPDQKGLIEVHGDNVEGAEIVIPALKITVNFKHPAAFITLAHIKNLARWTGRTNSKKFLTFDEGETLFLGARGREGSATETTVGYTFAMSENLKAYDLGDFQQIDKKGWELAWVSYEPGADNGGAGVGNRPVQKPTWLYVERLYDAIDLASALGFGS